MASDLTTILLPVTGDPVTHVWVPSHRRMVEGLKVEVKGMDVSRSAAARAHELGLVSRVRPLGTFPDFMLNVWICWVMLADLNRPQKLSSHGLGLDCVSVNYASRHMLLGPIVARLQENLRRARS